METDRFFSGPARGITEQEKYNLLLCLMGTKSPKNMIAFIYFNIRWFGGREDTPKKLSNLKFSIEKEKSK